MSKKLNSPLAEGGKGHVFEVHVQASFVILMLSGGNAPGLPGLPIKKIFLQAKNQGFETDDLVVVVENNQSQYKLLGQIKHKISFTKSDPQIGEVLHAAWNDFNNDTVFDINNDIIALITGPISKTDYHTVKWILDQARSVNTIQELVRRSELVKFSPPKSLDKLTVIKDHLTDANKGEEIDDELLLSFLKKFYLFGYDLGDRHGVIISYLFSHLSQLGLSNQRSIWSETIDYVQTTNQYAGIVTIENIPSDLMSYFEIKEEKKIPKDLKIVNEKQKVAIKPLNLNEDNEKVFLALVSLIGSWNEKYDKDISIILENLNYSLKEWESYSRGFLHSSAFISCKNNKWKITKRIEILEECADYLFDNHIDAFQLLCLKVFSEISPEYDLKPEDRFAAPIYGKTSMFSKDLKKGLAEGIAILGNNQVLFKNCSNSKIDSFKFNVVQEIFSNNNWKYWATINSYIPILSEVNPEQFLTIIDEKINSESTLFQNLFAQENSDLIRAENYLTGLLWGLESLAWKQNLFTDVCVCLGALASIDPGGNSSNRSINSLTAILLPWYPQTTASIEKRKNAVKSVLNEFPHVTWKLVLTLLPGNHQTTLGTNKPLWMNVDFPDENIKVSGEEYNDQVSFYADIAVNLSIGNIDRELELIRHIGSLPEDSFNKFLGILKLKRAIEPPSEDQNKIWEELTKLISLHKGHPDADWSLSHKFIKKLSSTANDIAPSNPIIINKKYFSDRDYELFDEHYDYDVLQEKLDVLRTKIIKGFLKEYGFDFLKKFTQEVSRPELIGPILAKFSDKDIERLIIPEYLDHDNNNIKTLARSYVFSKWRSKINEVSNLDISRWSINQKVNFLDSLPFTFETWEIVDSWLPNNEEEYWKIAFITSVGEEVEYHVAVKNLLLVDRPIAAIDCLESVIYKKGEIDTILAMRALKDAANSNEQTTNMDIHHIETLIRYIQNKSDSPIDELFEVECLYLSLFSPHQKLRPVAIENKLANEPGFFCSLIQSIYRSRKKEKRNKKITKREKNIAKNSWSVLHNWRTVPGTQLDGSFSESKFIKWINKAKQICNESGHYKVGFITIGNVLYHSPPDKSNLWINKTIAKTINLKEYKHLRQGYIQGTFNSRGTFWVDPSGAQEKSLSENYYEKAEVLEKHGFSRFASSLKKLANSYSRDYIGIISDD